MKNKHGQTRGSSVVGTHKAIGKPNRKAKAFAAANRISWLGVAFGVALGGLLLLVALSVGPRISREEVALAVKAQAVRSTPITPPRQTNVSLSVAAHLSQPLATAPLLTNAPPASRDSVSPAQHRAEYIAVGFDKLSAFPFTVTDQMVDATQDSQAAAIRTTSQIPVGIKALNEKSVAIKGFMLPMKFNGSLTTEFLILRSQGLCCYGVAPKITEWITVRLAGKGVKPVMDQPVTVCGTLHVGEVREHGDLIGIYSLDGEKIMSN
jgi:hypothetical protein